MKSKALKNVLNVNGVGIIGMYLVVFIGLSIACPNFLKFSNIMIGIRQAVYTAIVAFAMTFVISLGGIDLSVGSTVGISGMVLADTGRLQYLSGDRRGNPVGGIHRPG